MDHGLVREVRDPCICSLLPYYPQHFCSTLLRLPNFRNHRRPVVIHHYEHTQILLVLCYGINHQCPKAFNFCFHRLDPSLFDSKFYDISVMYLFPSLVYIYFTNHHFSSGFYFSAIVAAHFLLFPKWSNLTILLDNIIVSYIIHGYSSL